jgi:hypothetical protein
MTQPVMDMTLQPKGEIAPTAPNETDALIRAAMDPNVDTAKLSALIDMRERVLKIQAKEAFDRAFTRMQAALPVIIEHAKTNNGYYAPLEDIIEVIRPILAEYGFGLSHRTEWPEKGIVKIVGVLSHEQGHERTSEFISSADTSGNKNAIQGLGSAVAYGRRYTTKDLVNIVTRGEDDDARKTKRTPEPDGYSEWLDTLSAKADEGLPALQAMWQVANTDTDLKVYAAHLTKTEPETWNALKTRAAKVPVKK